MKERTREEKKEYEECQEYKEFEEEEPGARIQEPRDAGSRRGNEQGNPRFPVPGSPMLNLTRGECCLP
jgi:hypothetical protein